MCRARLADTTMGIFCYTLLGVKANRLQAFFFGKCCSTQEWTLINHLLAEFSHLGDRFGARDKCLGYSWKYHKLWSKFQVLMFQKYNRDFYENAKKY